MGILIKILTLLPAIIDAVRKLEEMAPMPGVGKDKANVILEIIRAVGIGLGEDLIPAVEKTISIVVGLANKLGLFKKG